MCQSRNLSHYSLRCVLQLSRRRSRGSGRAALAPLSARSALRTTASATGTSHSLKVKLRLRPLGELRPRYMPVCASTCLFLFLETHHCAGSSLTKPSRCSTHSLCFFHPVTAEALDASNDGAALAPAPARPWLSTGAGPAFAQPSGTYGSSGYGYGTGGASYVTAAYCCFASLLHRNLSLAAVVEPRHAGPVLHPLPHEAFCLSCAPSCTGTAARVAHRDGLAI